MPQYDESFISDDSANQRRNKRSYRVYKKGCLPTTLNGTDNVKNIQFNQQGSYVLKNNINNLKKNREFSSNFALRDKTKNEQPNHQMYPKAINKSFPSLLERDALFFNEDKYIFSPGSRSRDIYSKNNNYFSFSPGKSLENLARTNYMPIKSVNCISNGKSLQNLNDHMVRNNIATNKYQSKNSLGYLARVRSKEASSQNGLSSSYISASNGAINNYNDKLNGKVYENHSKAKEKAAIRLAARILESGVYRQLGKAKVEDNEDSGYADDFTGGDCESAVATPPSGGSGSGGSGHKGSFRSANKLARRARSFKEDLLERISAMAMRSPGQQSSNRSHSPHSPRSRGQPKMEDPDGNPSKKLENLVKQVGICLKHFRDVIGKNKLEMLPGNGTIILDTITEMHTIIRLYVSPLGVSPSAALSSALGRLCQAVARLIRLCDEGMMGGEGCAALDAANVEQITKEVHDAVEEMASIAYEKMGVNLSQMNTNGSTPNTKYSKLKVRPTVGTTPEGQRNSLPDIPLTPRERSMLEGSVGGAGSVRSSLSTESILDSLASTPHYTEPPPKPPRPIRSLDIAPPLPPKTKKGENTSLLGLGGTDGGSLQSHSSGSLDSMLNTSNDEIRAIMERNSAHLDDDIIGCFNCASSDGYTHNTSNSNRLSIESSSTVGSSPIFTSATPTCIVTSGSTSAQQQQQRLSGGDGGHLGSYNQGSPAHIRHPGETNLHSNSTNHNRFSNESGFVSMGTRCSEISYSSFNSVTTQQKTSLSFIDATPTPQDIPPSITDFITDNKIAANAPSPPPKTLGLNMASVVKQMSSSTNYFEQNTQAKTSFSQSSSVVKDGEQQIIENSSVTKRNISQMLMTNVKSNVSNVSDIIGNTDDTLEPLPLVPPALPVKTRKLKAQCDSLNDSALSSLNTTMDDQSIEYRNHSLCQLHPGLETFMQRPHTLMDHSSSNKPPPLPLKKKHMFQSVAYSVMAYMEMFGNCNRSPQNSMEFRHSVHTYDATQHPGGHFVHSSHLQQLASAAQISGAQDNISVASFQQNGHVAAAFSSAGWKGQTLMNLATQNGQAVTGIVQNGQIVMGNAAAFSQMSQSQTVHQFSMSSGVSNQQISATSSPLRSPRPLPDEGRSPPPPLPPPLPPLPPQHTPTPPSVSPRDMQQNSTPPALPPKKGKAIKAPSIASKTASMSGVSSPNTPSSLCGTPTPTPSSVRGASVSPQPKFQFDVQPPQPSHDVVDDALLMQNVEDERWQRQQEQSMPTKPGKFPVDDLDLDEPPNSIPPPPPQQARSPSPLARPRSENVQENEGELDLVLELDVTDYLIKKRTEEDGPEIRGGHPDALVVHAIKSTKDFSYQEAFLTTYRTFVTPVVLIGKLNRRHTFLSRHGKHTRAREVQALFTRVVGDLTIVDLDDEMLQLIMDFVYGLVCSGDLAMAKALRVTILEKYRNKVMMQQQQSYATMSARRDSILEQKPEALAEQMTLLDAELFTRIPAPEALLWARDQCEETSPNLTRFTEHFNKMSYWARSKILEQEDAKDREKYVVKFIKVMKHLRKMKNFNSYLALLSALDSAPIRRLEWQKHITDELKEYCALIDSSSSFRAYRQALAETQPPCIPYIGLVLQDLTFVHIGNTDLLPCGSVNFSKRWQQYHILENMKRFSTVQYQFDKNERIIAMFNGFNDFINEEAMWQISESIKPRGGRKTAAA